MAINVKLTKKIREALSGQAGVEEKKMFTGITFMVNDKMCISAGNDRIMCRIDPALHDVIIKRKGVKEVLMKGRSFKGFVYVHEDAVKTKKELCYWISLCLDFNKQAKKSVKKKKP